MLALYVLDTASVAVKVMVREPVTVKTGSNGEPAPNCAVRLSTQTRFPSTMGVHFASRALPMNGTVEHAAPQLFSFAEGDVKFS